MTGRQADAEAEAQGGGAAAAPLPCCPAAPPAGPPSTSIPSPPPAVPAAARAPAPDPCAPAPAAPDAGPTSPAARSLHREGSQSSKVRSCFMYVLRPRRVERRADRLPWRLLRCPLHCPIPKPHRAHRLPTAPSAPSTSITAPCTQAPPHGLPPTHTLTHALARTCP